MGPSLDETTDATRRTRLATERTELAWWRTGLTALAVALAVGRVIPGLDHTAAQWPYSVVGVCFAIYGVAVMAFGSLRRATVERALAEGHFPDPPHFAHLALALSGMALGLLSAMLIVID